MPVNASHEITKYINISISSSFANCTLSASVFLLFLKTNVQNQNLRRRPRVNNMCRINSAEIFHQWFSGNTFESSLTLDSEDDYRTDSRNVSHQQQFLSELHTPGRSHYTNYWYSWVQTIYFTFESVLTSATDVSSVFLWFRCTFGLMTDAEGGYFLR